MELFHQYKICVTRTAPFEASLLLRNYNQTAAEWAHGNAMPVPHSGKQFTVVAKETI